MRADGRRTPGFVMMRGALLTVLALSSTACKPLDDALAMVFGRSMRNSVSFDPYENPRLPAEGSVPFASGNYPAQVGDVGLGQHEPIAYDVPPFTAVDMARGVDAIASRLVNPVPADEASIARGELLYNRYCAICHGANGNGAESPIIEKLAVMAAYNLATGNAATLYNDGYIYGMIRVGRGLMPQYGHQIPHFDRWHVVNYLRQLQARAAPAADGGNG